MNRLIIPLAIVVVLTLIGSLVILPRIQLQRSIERIVTLLPQLSTNHTWLKEDADWLSGELRLSSSAVSNGDRRDLARALFATSDGMQIKSAVLDHREDDRLAALSIVLADRQAGRMGSRLDITEAHLGASIICGYRWGIEGIEAPEMDIYERDWSSSCSGEWNADSIVDRALIKYQQSFAEAARALNMTCQNRLSLANPAQIEIADACTASAVKARQDALIGAAAANPILRERTVVTPTPADDPDSPIVAITFLERHEIGLCNSAPYPGWMVIELGLPERAPELKSSYFPPGSCRLDTIQYGGSTLAIRVAFQPDRNSAEFVQVVKAEDIATQWQAAGGFRPDSASSILRICSTPSGYVDIESRPNCDATHLLELAPIQWGFIPVDQSVSGTPRPVRRLFWEAYDPLVVGRMPAWLMDRPNERSNFFEALGETLRARASDPGNAHSRLLLGIGACEDDDPLELGVPVCSVEAQPPHGMAVPVRNGEIVTHVAGVPVFELGDMRRALRNLDEAMGSNYESVSVAIEIRVSSDASERLALTYWNPNYFQGCSEDAPFLTSLLNSVFAGIPGAISPNSYGQLLRIRQFCSDDFQAGNLLGMFAGFTGTLAKMGAGALGREAGKGALRWLSSRTGQMVMQSLDEVAYAFATAPKLQDFRETARDAGQGILLGVGIGVVTSARTRQ